MEEEYTKTTFTPIFEAIADLHGRSGALTYGSIWRFCQGSPNRVCTAAIETISKRAYLSEKTVRRYISVLEANNLITTESTPGERLRIRCTDRLVQGEPTFYFKRDPGQDDRISGQDDLGSGQDDRESLRKLQEKEGENSAPVGPTIDEILGDEVLARSPVPKSFKPNIGLTEEEYKTRVLASMISGTVTAADVKAEVKTQLGLNIPKTKTGDRFLEWLLMEHRAGNTVVNFAHWWRTKDWRGIDGQQPSSLNQVETIWPQAFQAAPDEAEELKESKDGGYGW